MTGLWQQAEELLDTASRAAMGPATVILVDRQGGMRILDPIGWTMPALAAEFGASAIFKVSKTQGTTSVEGWAGSDRCLIERQTVSRGFPCVSLIPEVCHPIRLHVQPLPIAQSNDRESAVWNRY